MANIINRQQTFLTNGTVTAAGLHNLIDTALVNSAIIKNQQEITTIGTADLLLIAPDSVDASLAPRKVTVQNLIDDSFSAGTFTSLNLTGALTYGTATGTGATITTGTIPTLLSNNATIGTTTGTSGLFTSGTITTGLIPTLTTGTTTSTAEIVTSGTIATLNSTTGTIATLRSTNGTVATLNSTTGTITGLNSTTGTIATLNSTTGTITNLSTTLDGDFTITQGTGTIGTAKITPAKLSQPFTSGTAVASTSGTAIDFTGIPSWVKRVTVMFNGVSINTNAEYLVQIGSTTFSTTGYNSISNETNQANSTAGVSSTDGFAFKGGNAAESISGIMTIVNISSNTWVNSHTSRKSTTNACWGAGDGSTSGVLDRVRITATTLSTFDAGTVNIMYEG